MKTKYLKHEIGNIYYYRVRKVKKNEIVQYIGGNGLKVDKIIIHRDNTCEIGETCLENTINKDIIVIDKAEWNDVLDKAIKYINKLR